jgi:molybdenum cofactor cytidylyltransferase
MKASVQFGLSHVAEVHRPTDRDQWMVAPADLPRLSSGLINRLIDAGRSGKSSVVVPRYGERPGHPLLFPWSLSRQVFSLPENEGINRLLEAPNVEYLDLPSAARVTDVDTPQDYQEMFDESQKP